MKMRYRWVIERYVGALLGDEVLYAGFGDFHLEATRPMAYIWNAGDEPSRILEIISPAGFWPDPDWLIQVICTRVGGPPL